MVSRAEHRRDTLLRLSAATTAAYEEHGDGATVDDIAARAGVSRRTVFRYVDAKEDLAYIHPVLWLDVFDEAVADAADRPVGDRLLHAAERISRHIGEDPEPVKRAMAVALAAGNQRGRAEVNQRWIDRLATEIAGADPDDDTSFRAQVLGAALMGAIDAALAAWYRSPPDVELVDMVVKGLDYLAPILDEGYGRP